MCRLYLRVARLSDIVTNDGKNIQATYLNGTKINQFVSHDWPRQEKPSPPMWKLWKKCFSITSTVEKN